MVSHVSSPPRPFMVTGIFCCVFLLSLFIFYDAVVPLTEFSGGHNSKPVHIMLRELEKSSQKVLFAEHKNFENLSHDFDSLWSDILTPNGGFIMVVDEQEKKSKFGISMFHQLHCLELLRIEMQYLQNQVNILNKTAGLQEQRHTQIRNSGHGGDSHESGHVPMHNHEHEHDGHDIGHPMHCFDYLRQSLLCNADANLESPRKLSDGQGYAIDGMGERKCKNWDLLYTASTQSDHSPGSMRMLT